MKNPTNHSRNAVLLVDTVVVAVVGAAWGLSFILGILRAPCNDALHRSGFGRDSFS
jgi:hypothetical protein